jgi:hypothetical protein
LGQLLTQRQRGSGGIQPRSGGSPYEGATVDAIGRYLDANRRNTPIEKLSARAEFDKRAADLQSTQLANLADRGVAPVGTPGANLAQLVANQPTTPTPTDFGGLTNLAIAGGGVVQDLAKQRIAANEQERFNTFIQALKDRTLGAGGTAA